jgi:serine/threonine-protein kinase
MGEAMGTPAYMPPEQAEGQLDRIGPTSDVFGLGAILYHLLTGQPPYQGDDVLAQARQARIVPAQQRERSVPRALEAICVKALAREQKDRYPTAKALAREVEHWLADEPVEAYGEPVSDRLRRWGRQHRSLVSSGLVLLLAIVVGVCRWACGQWPRSRPGRPDSVIAP